MAQLWLARRYGATTHTNEKVLQFEPSGGGVRVTPDKGSIAPAASSLRLDRGCQNWCRTPHTTSKSDDRSSIGSRRKTKRNTHASRRHDFLCSSG